MFSFFKNDQPPYSVERIEQGQLLDKAEEVTIDVFFKHWMQKRPRKALVGTSFILHQDADFIYWGRPVFKRLFSDKRIVEHFYKTNIQTLHETFPDYKKRDGNHIRLRLQELMTQHLDDALSVSIPSFQKASLTKDTITLSVICHIQFKTTDETNNTRTIPYTIRLNKHSLTLIEVTPLN